MKEEWFLYIIKCRTEDLYVGIAKDVRKRIEEHNAGTACRYTKFRRPVELLYSESCGNYRAARTYERKVKKLSRKKKMLLVSGILE